MSDADLLFQPIRALAKRLHDRSLSPVALAEASLRRLETLGPHFNAVVTVMRAHGARRGAGRRSRAQGRACARAAARHPVRREGPARHEGRAHHVGRGAVSRPGVRLRRHGGHAAARRGRGAGRQAGDGRTRGRHGLQPRRRVVHRARPDAVEHQVLERRLLERPRRAVAAGLVSFAIGSETSGSILTPSAYCGVTGLRPTYGLVSRHGAMALSWTLDKLGPHGAQRGRRRARAAAIAGPDLRTTPCLARGASSGRAAGRKHAGASRCPRAASKRCSRRCARTSRPRSRRWAAQVDGHARRRVAGPAVGTRRRRHRREPRAPRRSSS